MSKRPWALLSSGVFELTKVDITQTEKRVVKKARDINFDPAKPIYYMSMARTINSSFTQEWLSNGSRYTGVVFELDAERLRNHYKIVPVDYFWAEPAHSSFSRPGGYSEQEERLLSKDDRVPIKYIKAVHIYSKSKHRDPIENDLFAKKVAGYERLIDRIEAGEKVVKSGLNTERVVYWTLEKAQEMLDRTVANGEANRNYEHYEEDQARKYAASGKYDVPFYLYHNRAAFNAGRWAEAEQLNPDFRDDDDEEA